MELAPSSCIRSISLALQVVGLASLGWFAAGCSSPLVQNGPIRSIVPGKKKPETQLKVFRSDLAVMPFAEMDEDRITIRYVRDCRYRTEDDYDVRYYDLNFRLEDVKSVDFIIVPFKETQFLAHTMLSFGLADGRHFVISVEARLGADETYTAVAGAGRRYPLMYVIGDERDLILLRTSIRDVEVYLYKGKAAPQQVQNLLVDMLKRANKLYREPEFYDTLTNNCTTNLVRHVNQLRPGRIPHDMRVLFPGHSDRMAYDLGLLEIEGPFEYARNYAKINDLAQLYADSPEFSKRIRRQ
ncbi:MAG: DUF4105 domain-containing protein [Planctomycetota bacterium]|jgi:hypothetical protein